MAIKVILPTDLHGLNVPEIIVKANTIGELLTFIKEKHQELSEKLLDKNGNFKNNVILISDETIIPREEYFNFLFTETSTLEIMFQFAGG
jgi:hypothetical protein